MSSRWRDNGKAAKARRSIALERHELRASSSERIAPAGPTSFPIKARDPDLDRMIAEALKNKNGGLHAE